MITQMANNNGAEKLEDSVLRRLDRSSDYKRCRHKHTSVVRLATSDFNILKRIAEEYPICEIADVINPVFLQFFVLLIEL